MSFRQLDFSSPPGSDLEALGSASSEGAVEPTHLTSATIRLWNAFAPLALEQRRWALAIGAVETFRAGEACLAGDDVAVVVQGCLSLDAAGSQLAADLLGPGDVLTTGASRSLSGQWITDGELFRVSLTDWVETAGMDGMSHLLAAADRRRAAVERRVLCATTHRATGRVADFILAVHEIAPRPSIALSQERLGGMLGLRRTTVNGSCRDLELGGASRTRRGQIRVIDAGVLAEVACGCRRTALAPAYSDARKGD